MVSKAFFKPTIPARYSIFTHSFAFVCACFVKCQMARTLSRSLRQALVQTFTVLINILIIILMNNFFLRILLFAAVF